jgi:hypothetical protein
MLSCRSAQSSRAFHWSIIDQYAECKKIERHCKTSLQIASARRIDLVDAANGSQSVDPKTDDRQGR